jgi:hypothetical protein
MMSGSRADRFTEGSLVILSGIQEQGKTATILSILQQGAREGIDVHSYNTQLTSSGPGLGTSHFKLVPEFKPLLVVGRGTRTYDAGEAWFQLDQNLGVAPVMTNLSRLKSINLSDYSHLLMVDGRYSDIGKKEKQRIASWIDNGGILVAVQGAASWSESLCFASNGCEGENSDKSDEAEPVKDIAYGDFDDQRAQKAIGGAIVKALADTTHPIAWGYDGELPLFRRGSTLLKASENPFSTPVRYAQDPLVSGYIGEQRLTEMSGQAAIIAERHGKGAIIRFANNPIFRGFWRGTERLWVNSLYFGPVIRTTELPK